MAKKIKMTDEEKENLLILKNEIAMSIALIDDEVVPDMQDALARYTGEYIPPYAVDIVLNEVYPIIQYEMPSIFFKAPRAFLKPRQKNYIAKKTNIYTGKKEEVFVDAAKSAKTQEHILNYSIEQMKYKKEMRKVLLDALLFKYGAMWHGYKGSFGMTEENSIYIKNEKIFVKRISPKNIIFDPKVTLSTIDEAEWVGRVLSVPLRDIKDDPELNVDDRIKGKLGFGQTLKSDLKQGGDTKNLLRSKRKLIDFTDSRFKKHAEFITLYEVFKKPTKKEARNGGKGSVLLLTDEQQEPLRLNDWPYKTDEWSLKILQFNDVPDNIFGMSDIDVWGNIADHKNIVVNLQLRNAESNTKNIVFFNKDGMDEEEVQKVQDGEQVIVGVDGTTKDRVSVATPGSAASSELYLLDGRVQNNLDEKSGVNDLKKGSLRSGEESATSVRIRNAGSSARPSFRQDIMADFLIDSFKFLNDLNQQFMPIKDAVRIMGSLDIEWSENPTKEDVQADVDVEIDVISMLPESPEKELEQNSQVLKLMTDALTVPQIMTKISQEGKTFNLAPIIEQILHRLKIRDPEAFRNLRPEESQGFASVAELKAAEANIKAILSGQPLPSPPAEGQSHVTRIGAYDSQRQILALQGQVNEILEQLIMVQMQLAEQESKQKAPRSGEAFKPAKMTAV
jgi:hypothetical protein